MSFSLLLRGCLRGVMVKAMDCGIVVNEFVLQSFYYVLFRANTLRKRMNPPLASPSYGLKSTTTILLGEWVWHWITYKCWYAIEQRNQTLLLKLCPACLSSLGWLVKGEESGCTTDFWTLLRPDFVQNNIQHSGIVLVPFFYRYFVRVKKSWKNFLLFYRRNKTIKFSSISQYQSMPFLYVF